jgi:hypothetical protein
LEVKKMQKRTFYFFGLLIILLFGSSMVLGAESNFCPDPSSKGQTVLDLPQVENPALRQAQGGERSRTTVGGEEILVSGKSVSVKRNQVLLEIAEGTW